MCRLLAVKDANPFAVAPHLLRFAEIARGSREYQGDGWGCAWIDNGRWRVYKNLRPVWEDDLAPCGETTLLLAHARSAFRNEGITIENNMPFVAGPHAFIFNGELHGVRIRERGSTGAAKLFRFILRFEKEGLISAVQRSAGIVLRRSDYVKAMNVVVASPQTVAAHSLFNEAEDYFTMHLKRAGKQRILCSEPYRNDGGWSPVKSGALVSFQ